MLAAQVWNSCLTLLSIFSAPSEIFLLNVKVCPHCYKRFILFLIMLLILLWTFLHILCAHSWFSAASVYPFCHLTARHSFVWMHRAACPLGKKVFSPSHLQPDIISRSHIHSRLNAVAHTVLLISWLCNYINKPVVLLEMLLSLFVLYVFMWDKC